MKRPTTMLDCLNIWCQKWRLKVNITKSNVIPFRNARKRRSDVVFNIGTNKIDYVSSYKYLGLILDEHLTFAEAIKGLCNSANRALGSLISKFK